MTAALAMLLLCTLWWVIYVATLSKMETAVEEHNSSVLDFMGGGQMWIVAGLICIAAGLSNAIHGVGGEHGTHLTSGALMSLCLGLILTTTGVGALEHRAWLVTLGVTRVSDQEAEHSAARSPLGQALGIFVMILPILLIWKFCGHAAPWVVLTLLWLHVAFGAARQAGGEAAVRRHWTLVAPWNHSKNTCETSAATRGTRPRKPSREGPTGRASR